jgi:hypothetical protein
MLIKNKQRDSIDASFDDISDLDDMDHIEL